MTVLDFGAKRRRVGRSHDRVGSERAEPAEDASSSTVRKPESPAPNPVRGLGVVSTAGGSAVVTGAVIRHPLHEDDEVVAFLIIAGSDADTMLRSTLTAEFSFDHGAPGTSFRGPVELIRAGRGPAEWFRWLVGEVFTAAGATTGDVAVHDATIGISSTVVAFLRPQEAPVTHGAPSPETGAAASAQRQGRRVGHLVVLPGGRSG